MLTFCFDEQGDFEGNAHGNLFIGGFFYISPDETDTINEKKRITAFFQTACTEAETVFPRNLHPYERVDQAAIKTKQEYNSHFLEFLQNGTYNGSALFADERKGKYTILLTLSTPHAPERYNNSKADLFESDSKITNRYAHITQSFIEYMLYANPSVTNGESVCMEFPTRVIFQSSFTGSSYDDAGYNTSSKGNFYYDTTPETYHTMLREISKRYQNDGVTIDKLSVRPISDGYRVSSVSEFEPYAFLCFSDAVCSYIGELMNPRKGGSRPFYDYVAFRRMLEEKFGAEVLFSLYDDSGEDYLEAYLEGQRGNLFDSLKKVCQIGAPKTPEAAYYRIEVVPGYCDSFKVSENTLTKESAKILKAMQKREIPKAMLIADALQSLWKKEIIAEKSLEQKCILADLQDLKEKKNQKEHYYLEAEQCVEKRGYYDALLELSYLYNGNESKDFSALSKEIIDTALNQIEPKEFEALVKALDNGTRENLVNTNLAQVISWCENIKEERKFADINHPMAAFYLYDAGMALCNHEGKPQKAQEYFEKIKKLKELVSPKEYNRGLIRNVVSNIDLLNYDQAFFYAQELTKESLKGGKKLKEMFEDMDSTEQAIHYSQFAQVCCFISEDNTMLVESGKLTKEEYDLYKKMPKSFFENALLLYPKESPDAQITRSYYLHFLISLAEEAAKNGLSDSNFLAYREQYDRQAELYFKEKTFPEQLKKILGAFKEQIGNIHPEYSLAIWCKALMIFGSDKEKAECMEQFPYKVVKEYIKERHPWELILYYLAVLYQTIGNKDRANECLTGLSNETFKEPLLRCITANAKRRYYRFTKETKKEVEEAEHLYELIKDYTSGRLPKSKKQLDGIFTYTYC